MLTAVRLSRAQYLPAFLASLALIPHTAAAAHWQEVGQVAGGSPGRAYVDLDSIRQDGGFRIALFLTIYANGALNSNSIRIDRIAQETAFDCAEHRYSLKSTVGYNAGKAVGGNSDKSDWTKRFRALPEDAYSQHAFDLACKSPLPQGPEITPEADSPGLVNLPAPPPG